MFTDQTVLQCFIINNCMLYLLINVITTYNVLLRYVAYVSRRYSLLSFYNELLFR